MHLRTDAMFMTDAGEQKVILDAGDSSYVTANGAGRVILDALTSDVSLPDLIGLLRTEYDLDDATASRDCLAFLADLDRRGWLVGGPGSSSSSTWDT